MAYRRDLIGPIALLVIGVILLLRNLGYISASFDQWWPVILILIGLGVVFRRPSPEETVPPNERTATERRHPPTGGLILIGLGLALLVSNLLGGRGTGALILIALGLALLIGRIW